MPPMPPIGPRWVAWIASAVLAHAAHAATPGFVEDFSSGTGGFASASTVTRVASGGVGGASDGFLQVSNAFATNLGAFSQAAPLVGNLPADHVTGYSFWLRDVGANNSHVIHVGIGVGINSPNPTNFWQSVQGFVPPDGTWQQFTVDVTDPSQWVQILGSGTFQQAVAASDRLLFRHDLPPFMQTPDPASGEFGLDRIQVLPAPVPSVSAPGLAALGALVVALAALVLHRRPRLSSAR